MPKHFIKNNESFVCINCRKLVEKHLTSSRDHCNHCLYGLHVDINPGDRLNMCRGLLKPIGLKIYSTKTQIIYVCRKCDQQIVCVKSEDDSFDEIVRVSKLKWKEKPPLNF